MAAESATAKSASPTMWERLRDLPGDLRGGYALGKAAPLPAPAGPRVLLAGMGGSGLAALLAAGALDPDGRRVTAVRDERLPGGEGADGLAIFVSYSGDTAETLAAFEEAGARGLARVAVASGGELARRAEARELPLVRVPGGSPPRAAVGHLAGALLALLERAIGAPGVPASVEDAARLLERLHGEWGATSPEPSNAALSLAREIGGRVPLVYASARLRPAAERWKTQMNENAKTPAFAAYFPELGHNEIQGWEGRGVADVFHVLLPVDPEDGPAGERRAAVALDLLGRRRVPGRIIRPPAGDRLARLLALVSLADHTSLHLAALRGMDPAPVATIQEWKERTREGAS